MEKGLMSPWQEISVHGAEPATSDDGAKGEDSGYSEDAGYGAILKATKGASTRRYDNETLLIFEIRTRPIPLKQPLSSTTLYTPRRTSHRQRRFTFG